MGFWSWVGDKISSVADTVSSVASSVVDTVKDTASAIWEGAKTVAKKVVDTCVNVGEKIVGGAKKVYETVKKVVKKAAPIIKTVARLAGETLGKKYPWIKTASEVIIKGVEYLEKLTNSSKAKKIMEHLEWALKKAKQLKEILFGKQEEREAEARQKELQEAMNLMQTEEQKKSIRFAMVINSLILVKTRVQNTLENFDISENMNFDHYLRLRATQRLLQVTERRLQRATDITQVTESDLFLIEIGAKLLDENPELSNEDGIRLDKIVRKRFSGKGLLPLVFEELLDSWNARLNEMQDTWECLRKEYSSAKNKLKRIEIKSKIEKLTFEEEVEYTKLRDEVRDLKYDLNYQEIENLNMENYVYAAEGFLQVLEKTQDQWQKEDREWILEDSQEVGVLLIQCIENGKEWEMLTDEQQSLIIDFANLFKEDSKMRTEANLKAKAEEYQENYLIEVAA